MTVLQGVIDRRAGAIFEDLSMHFVKHPHLHPSQKTPPPTTAEPLPDQLKHWLALASMLLIWCGGLVTLALFGLWHR
jgi:hypothetical protein